MRADTPAGPADTDGKSASAAAAVEAPSNDGGRSHDLQDLSWPLQEGLRLLLRRPRAYLATLILLLGSSVSSQAYRLVSNTGTDRFLVWFPTFALSIVVSTVAILTLTRILAGELAGRPLTWRLAQRWARAHLGRALRFGVRYLAIFIPALFVPGIVLAIAVRQFGGTERSAQLPFTLVATFIGLALSLRWPNLFNYYVILEEDFWPSMRLAFRESGRQLRAYAFLAVLVSLPGISNWVPYLDGTTTTAIVELSPWQYVSMGLSTIISPVVNAAWLILWLRNGGDRANLAAFDRVRL